MQSRDSNGNGIDDRKEWVRFAFDWPGELYPHFATDHLLEQNLKLEFGQTRSHAAMDTISEREVPSRLRTH